MRQEINELKQDIRELEQEIAEAKINNPDEVPQLQKELASLKKIVESFEKMAGNSPNPTPTVHKLASTQNSVNQSPIERIILSRQPTTPKPGEDTDRLLWYRGKKINDSTLITNKSMVVQFQKSQNRVVAQPDKKTDPFEPMIRELEKAMEREEELIEKFARMENGFLYYPELEKTLSRYEDLNEEYSALVKNVIELPELSAKTDGKYAQAESETGGIGSTISNAKDFQNLLDYEETMAKARRLFKALPPVEDFPAPPEDDLSVCGACDPELIKKERKAKDEWHKKFIGQEEEIRNLILGMERQYALLGSEDHKISPQSINFLDSLDQRERKKLQTLMQRYGNQITRFNTVLIYVLGYERKKQLLGSNEGSIVDYSSLMSNLDSIYTQYLNEQIQLKNHDFVLNIPRHISLERQKRLLGDESPPVGVYGLGKNFDKAVAYNRFALKVNLQFEYEQTDDEGNLELKATGSLLTPEKVYTMLITDGCTYSLVKHKVDFTSTTEKEVAIPIEVKSGAKTILDEEDRLITFSYTGPNKYLMNFPEFKLDFCTGRSRDSVYFMPLFSEEVNMPLGNLNKSYTSEMLPMANHIFVNIVEMEEQLEKGMELAAEIITSVTAIQSAGSGISTREKLRMQYETKQKQDNYRKDINKLSANTKTVFTFDARNRSSEIINATQDTKHEIDEYSRLTVGKIHIQVVHDPFQ
ncbi:hypothetical protein GCM10011361_21550 [Muriicola marianensis]|uniref:Uncharacterized protein n=2 Tax=Muriicola marianensis TaxID=1324801 RepID=A0ABQ1R1B9_9FLAO|nr:hypothetical protein GCM10011361_21550 [Muriicola marianensis]